MAAQEVKYTGSGCDDEQELTFYLPDAQSVRRPGVLEQLLLGLVRRGFVLAAHPPASSGAAVRRDVSQGGSPGAPSGLPASVAERVAAFTAGQGMCGVVGLGGPQAGELHGLNFLFVVDAERRRARFWYTYRFFEHHGDPRSYDRWLEVLGECVSALRPTYGYAYGSEDYPDLGGLGAPPHEERENAEDEAAGGLIRDLYSLNYFGPAIVERIGADRIETAPAQRIIRLDVGGYLFVPQTHLLPTPPRTHHDTALVAFHLGLGRGWAGGQGAG